MSKLTKKKKNAKLLTYIKAMIYLNINGFPHLALKLLDEITYSKKNL